MKSRGLCFIILFGSLVMSSCSLVGKKVQANERDILSKPGMQLLDSPKENTSMNHMFNAREGSVGGFGGAGGGCGCN
jgi:hypothetical protein